MTQITIPTITNDGHSASRFDSKRISLSGEPMRMLSDQQTAENFRLRTSSPGYVSDFHVAGDPTLLIILGGVVKIELRDGDSKTFAAGEMFIAEDYLAPGAQQSEQHGHMARVVGSTALTALHLKLARR